MDKKVISTILEQNLETVKSFISMMISEVKKEVELVKNENEELKKSLQFSQEEIDDLKNTVKRQSQEIKTLQEKTEKTDELAEKVRVQDDMSRRNNLRMEGMPEKETENYEQTQAQIETLLSNKMNIAVKLESANRVGKKNNSRSPRPIIARFATFTERQKCMKSSAKLKGTNIYINEDLSKETAQRRMAKMDELREKRNQGFLAYFIGDRLVVKERRVAIRREATSDDMTGETEDRPTVATRPASLTASSTSNSAMEDQARNLRSGNRGRTTIRK